MNQVDKVESHPFEPFLPEGARLLMLGTFPPAEKRWSMPFFYPNFTNDMWRIVGYCFFGDKLHFVADDGKHYRLEELKAFLTSRGIALYDTCTQIIPNHPDKEHSQRQGSAGGAADRYQKYAEALAEMHNHRHGGSAGYFTLCSADGRGGAQGGYLCVYKL